MWRSSTSLPEGQARCLPCRRKAHGLAPGETFKGALKSGRLQSAKRRGDCHRCGVPVPAGTRRWKFCTEECFRKARNARGSGKPSSAERGYDSEHVKLRARLLPLAYGTDCVLCGEVMNEGDRLHLDHNEDRTGYRGMAHDYCNVLDGARRGGERARQARLKNGWRPGQDPCLRQNLRMGA